MTSDDLQPTSAGTPLWFLIAMMSLVTGTAFVFLFLGRWTAPGANLPEDELKILSLAYEYIDRDYIYDLPEDRRRELLEQAVAAMVKGLPDKYSTYIPPRDIENYNRRTRGVMTGIGVVVVTVDSQVVVLYPHPGGPAEHANLQVGDVVTAAHGQPVSNSQELVDRARGEAGSAVRLTIQRGAADPFDVEVNRASVSLPSVKWARILDRDAGIGYLYLESFDENCAEEVDAALQELERAHGRRLSGLVLDLRHNSGGLLDSCLELTNRFIFEGTMVTLKRRNLLDAVHIADPAKCTHRDLPLVLILDELSASATEVLAGALQDHGRARVVGTRSYGKGVVQNVFSWEGRKLKLTTSYYLTPNGRNIENELRPEAERGTGGIIPDRTVEFSSQQDANLAVVLLSRNEVPTEYSAAVEDLRASNERITIHRPLEAEQDVQLAAALEEIAKMLADGKRPSRDKDK